MRIAYRKLALHTKTESNAGSKFVTWEDAAIRPVHVIPLVSQ